MKNFIGRQRELDYLKEMHEKDMPVLVVVKGRRGVGKSCLINSFASSYTKNRFWSFSGLAPKEDVGSMSQLEHFASQLADQLKIPPFTFRDWLDAFEHLGNYIKPGDIILFDEISWMGRKDPSFIPKLQFWWDKRQQSIMLFMCGANSKWIEENILKSTAFFDRINLTINLRPFLIPEANKLLRASGFKGSDYDTYRLLSILGGIPWYLKQVTPGQSVNDLIKHLCFEDSGLLVQEFDRIFHDLFGSKGTSYKKILGNLVGGMKTLSEVRKSIGFSNSGTLSSLMENLIIAGFVQKQNLWSFKTNKPLKQSLYRICDPYMRFYLKLIEPQLNKISLNGFRDTDISSYLGFESHIGFQIEQLLLQNDNILIKSIGINPVDIVAFGPFRQSKTAAKDGCQIDYLIQTRTKNLFICEFKFKLKELGSEIISEVQAKEKALKAPKGFATIPVLFHIGGVSGNVATCDYFYRIVDIADFLTPDSMV